ncbi:MAG: hypothetical protein KDD16_00635 [Mangrovimonas sp.]|nr:hypothetical protein [Mangrovimonas sp.]MCB0434724.1 hypothetical protein [Mangrovimonas sp.]
MKKTISVAGFLILYSSFHFACKSSSTSLEKYTLNSTCIESLNIDNSKLSKDNGLDIKQFLSENGCDEKTIAFAKRAIEALEKGDIEKVSLACLNKYFELNQNLRLILPLEEYLTVKGIFSSNCTK